MKFRSLHKWDNIPESKGLIYVAQLLDELLFEFTLDTYKPSAMNTSLLVREALSTIDLIKSGVIKRPNINHVLDELCLNLKKDEVAKSLITVDLGELLDSLYSKNSTYDSLTTTVELLNNQIPLKIYKKRNEELLIKEITEGQDFYKLRSLTRSYTTTLLNYGYSPRYIKEKSTEFFFYSSSRISGNNAIFDYIEIFSGEETSYAVIYRAPNYLHEFIDSGKNLGIDMAITIPEYADQIKNFDFELHGDKTYLFFKNIKAKDQYSAKMVTDGIVELLQTLVGLFHHKQSPDPIVECLVINIESKKCVKVKKSINPMHKCHDSKTGVASKKLTEFMAEFSMRRDSFRKFNRSAELHALALSSESLENQMINLWIALESLIPSKSDDNEISQIEHIVSSVLPFLNLIYIRKIVTRFSKDSWKWDSKLIKTIIRNVEADGYLKKIVHLMSLDEYQDLRDKLELSFKDFYLLKDRYSYIRFILSDPKNIIKSLDDHERRVAWQIRRIYRARNLIVHDGNTPSYTDVLIENTHDYLDSIVNSLMFLASSKNRLNSIDQGFKMVQLNYTSYYKSMNKKDLKFSNENIDRLLFKYALNA